MAFSGRGAGTGKNMQPAEPFPWLYRNPDLEYQDELGEILGKDEGTTGTRSMITVQAGVDELFVPLYYGGPFLDGAIITYADQYTSGVHKGKLVVMYLHGWGPLGSVTGHTFENGTAAASLGIAMDIRTGLNNTVSPILQSIWPTCSSYPGMAYTVCRFPIDPIWPASDPYSFRVSIPQGLLIRNTRVSFSTAFASLVYSNNVALCKADMWTNKRYALGRVDSSIDFTTVNESADDCDVVLANGQKRFQLALKIDDGDFEKWDQNISWHAQMFSGVNNGKYQMFVDKPRTASGLILKDTGTDHQIVSATFRVKDTADVPNEVSFEYTASSNDYKTEKATTRHPGLDNGTIIETIETTFQTKGSPSFDQSKRLSVWGFNRKQLSDKEYFVDTVYDTGVQCVPGMRVTVISRHLDWASQDAIIITTTRRGRGFRLKVEKYDAAIYSDTQHSDQTLPAPFGPDPYAAVPDPENVTVVPVYNLVTDSTSKTGVVLTATFDKPTGYQFFSRFAITVTRTKTGETTTVNNFAEPKQGPVQIPVAADGATYTVLIQSISTREIFSTGVSTPVTPTVTTVEAPVLFKGSSAAGWYWDAPPVRTAVTFAAAAWTASNLIGFTAANIQNGDKTVSAFRFGDGSLDRTLTLSTGGVALDEFVFNLISTPFSDVLANDPLCNDIALEYSNSLAGPWTVYPYAATTVLSTNFKFTGRDKTRVVFTIDRTITGIPLFWRFHTSSGGFSTQHPQVSEVECYTFGPSAYPHVAGFVITRVSGFDNGTFKYETSRIGFQPSTTRRISDSELVAVVQNDSSTLLGGFGTKLSFRTAFIQTVNTKGEVSEGRQLEQSTKTALTHTTSEGLPQDWQPNATESVALSATNNDLHITPLVSVLRFTASANATVTGLDNGYSGRLVVLTNDSSFTVTLSHASGSSLAVNRFDLDAVNAFILGPGKSTLICYDSVDQRWKTSVSFAPMILADDEQNNYKALLAGQEFYQAANTDTNGLALCLGVNRASNRQLWLMDSANMAQNTTNPVLVLYVNAGIISSQATDGSTMRPLTVAGSTFAIRTAGASALQIDASQNVTVDKTKLTVSSIAPSFNGLFRTGLYVTTVTAANIVALGAVFSGDIALCTLPAKTRILNVMVIINTPAASVTTLNGSVGTTAASYANLIPASNMKAGANTVYGDLPATRGGDQTGFYVPSVTGTTVMNMHFVSTTLALNTTTAFVATIYIDTEVLP